MPHAVNCLGEWSGVCHKDSFTNCHRYVLAGKIPVIYGNNLVTLNFFQERKFPESCLARAVSLFPLRTIAGVSSNYSPANSGVSKTAGALHSDLLSFSIMLV